MMLQIRGERRATTSLRTDAAASVLEELRSRRRSVVAAEAPPGALTLVKFAPNHTKVSLSILAAYSSTVLPELSWWCSGSASDS